MQTSEARLVLCEVLTRIAPPEEASARALIEKQLTEVASEAERDELRGPLAGSAEVRAALAEKDGNTVLREKRLREARELYASYEATGHVQRVERELKAL